MSFCWSICSCIPDGHINRATNQMSHRYDNSSDDGHMAVRNILRIEINIQGKIVREVSYLQGSIVFSYLDIRTICIV